MDGDDSLGETSSLWNVPLDSQVGSQKSLTKKSKVTFRSQIQ